MLTAILLYICLGIFVGLVAGLFGVGGGAVVVPMLVFSLHDLGLDEQVMHLALGTSFSTIVFTSLSSLLAHHRRGGVLWQVVRDITPGILVGVALGALLAAWLRSIYLQIFFSFFLFYTAAKMFRKNSLKAERQLPGKAGLAGVGAGIGFVSSLVGIGGGSLTVPYLTWCNVEMRKAVGSSAAVGLPIALAGAVMYMITGRDAPGLPAYSLGFIYLPATLGISMASIVTAPLGSALAHRLPVPTLRKLFALLLAGTGLRMLWLALDAA